MTAVETSDSRITERVTVTQQQHTCISEQIGGCAHALGMENLDIPQKRIVISSRGTYNIINSNTNTTELKKSAQFVRLNHNKYWVPDSDDPSPWVQVYLGLGKIVSGIIIQGLKQLWTRHDFIKVQATACTDDPELHMTLMFEKPVNTSVIRVQPQDCLEITKNVTTGIQITISDCAMKMEILGCENTQEIGCVKPLGMESHEIDDAQISVSSNVGKKNYARLYDVKFWSASLPSWIKVNLNHKVNISGIIIQGSGNQWVERCIIEADTSAMSGSQEFEANFDGYTPVSIIFEEPVETSYIKVTPTVCHGGYCKLRMEILRPCMSG
ncbi:lactadherin-like [Amphiura filiformis]|uniref:lactadherin-like n=1 Tax=Amphiura filiformis TaxID=82378 RepID=UPI003B2178A4